MLLLFCFAVSSIVIVRSILRDPDLAISGGGGKENTYHPTLVLMQRVPPAHVLC